MGKYPQVLLNSLGTGAKYPTRPDFRALVDQHIHLAVQPTRHSLSDALRILNRLNDPAEAKFDGCQAHRMVLTPKPERGLVAIVGHNGLFLRENRRRLRGTLGRPKLGPNCKRGP